MGKVASGKRTLKLTPNSDLEFSRDPNFFVLGLDEVGVGCLAGPVVAACYAYRLGRLEWDKKKDPRVVDSKKLTEENRTAACAALKAAPEVFYSVQEASPAEIDQINILRAAQLAMERAFREVARQIGLLGFKGRDCVVLIDGNRLPPFLTKLELGGLEAIVKGDAKSFAIAAASILAKDHRDSLMSRLASDYPLYGWEGNVGYPTPEHKAAIVKHGYTIHHRRSFRLNVPGADGQTGLEFSSEA